VLKRLERVFEWAIERGFRSEPNPCSRLRLSDYFETSKRKTKHHPPMPWQVLPEFLQWLRTKEDLPAYCLELQILCCTRPSEARLARWAEVDFENAIWTIPPHRMKMGYKHRIPLSPPALALLRRLYELRTSELIFPPKSGKTMCPDAVAERIPKDRWLTPEGEPGHAHGFRASFAMWAAENDLSHEVREKCLAHGDPNPVVRAYQQSDLLDQRRDMLQKWADFLGGGAA
jgi:integrase